MLCCAIENKGTRIEFASSTSMQRDVYTDNPTNPTSSNAYEPGYPKYSPSSCYPPGGYQINQHPLPTSEAAYPGSNLSNDYASQFFGHGIFSHNESVPSQSNWGASTVYPPTALPSALNANSNWDVINPQYPTHHPSSHSAQAYPIPSSMCQVTGIGASNSPAASLPTLTGIECFSSGPEVGSSVLAPPMHPVTMTPQRKPYEWINKNAYQNPQAPQGKTRTKDKYRVVYSDHQRLELEKEFRYSRYITIRRKSELAGQLSLSERQVKIWFQNRRAKERKATKKNPNSTKLIADQEGDDVVGDDVSDHSGPTLETSPGLTPLLPTSSHGGAIEYGQVDLPQDRLTTSQEDLSVPHPSHAMPYPYNLGSPQPMTYVPMSEIDVKPLIIDDSRGSTSSIQDANAQGTSSSQISE